MYMMTQLYDRKWKISASNKFTPTMRCNIDAFMLQNIRPPLQPLTEHKLNLEMKTV